MSVGRICSRVVATATPEETVATAARRMVRNDVGTLVVVDGHARVIGVLTDRDIAARCVAPDLDPTAALIGDVMTSPVESASEDTTIVEAVSHMATKGIRRLIITGHDQRLVGVLSLDDILELLTGEFGHLARLLEKQRPSVPA
jgi:CBS domain-containing protein